MTPGHNPDFEPRRVSLWPIIWARVHGVDKMRMMLALFAIGAGAYAMSRRSQRGTGQSRAAFAEGQPHAAPNPVRDAGPEAMRDSPQTPWTKVDQASDESFPASDPPATY